MNRVSLLAAAAACVLGTACSRSSATPTPPPPPVVRIVEAAPRRVALTSEWIATLDGSVNAQIRPQVSGYLVQRTYTEGAFVKKGQVLFQIDPRSIDAALAQSEAQLGQAKAELGRTERDLQRDRPLAEQRAIAQSQLDNDVQANLAAEAAVKSATAAVESARLNKSFTRVTSLIDGIAAIATAQIGDLVGPSTLLTTVSKVDPVRAYFSLSEQEYFRIANRPGAQGGGSAARKASSEQPWTKGPGLTLVLGDGTTYGHEGRIDAIDRQVDPKTGTIRVSAVFPNPGNILRPGQYGRVRAETLVVPDAIVVPQRAVTELQGSQQVRVVTGEGHVAVRTVTLGQTFGSDVMVSRGIAAGDRVVVEGPALVPPDVRVRTTPYEAAANDATPGAGASGGAPGAPAPGGGTGGAPASGASGPAPAGAR